MICMRLRTLMIQGRNNPFMPALFRVELIRKKDFIERVSRHQPFPHNIIEGVLGAVVDELVEALADGYIVELGELGHFSISLKCTHKVMTKKEIRAESIRFDNVHLRTSKEFKKKIKREIELERVENSKVKTHDTKISIEDRLQMLQEFLKKNGGITRIEYSRLTGLPRLKAIDDLNTFIKEGTLRKRGAGRTVFYVWKQEE